MIDFDAILKALGAAAGIVLSVKVLLPVALQARNQILSDILDRLGSVEKRLDDHDETTKRCRGET